MVMNGTNWEMELRSRVEYGKENLKKIKEEKPSVDERMEYWQEYVSALEKILKLESNHNGIRLIESDILNPENLKNISVKDAMIEIARVNNGLLVVVDAATALINAGMFEDRDHARNSIYSNIGHYRNYFQKERAGVYRLVGKYRLI